MTTIMVLHKDTDTRLSIKVLLEKNGYDVITVVSFDDFSEKLKNNKIDLVLIDGLIPRKKILEILQKKNIKTAYFVSDVIDEEEMRLYKNVVGSVEEAFNIDDFLGKIKKALK